MFYAKLKDGNVEQYPYTLTDLRRDYPNTSFPDTMTDAELLAFNTVPVAPTEPPVVNYTKDISRWAINQGGSWVEVWTVTDASQQEIADRLANQWQSVRSERDRILYSCDWTQLSDVPLTAEQVEQWRVYRQQVRDVTNQPDPFNIVWPVAPQT